ncbi:MAG: hypothetical protein WD077_05475 [Bacteroidia bacterium]
MKFYLIAVAALMLSFLLNPVPLLSQETPDDTIEVPPPKVRKYSLGNPVPDRRLRDLSPDRPDYTESPITVDAGRAQIETDFVLFDFGGNFFDEDRPVYLDNVVVLNNIIKVGLSQQVDMQLVLPLLSFREEQLDSQTQLSMNFVPAAGLRFKFNLVGNNGSKFALGVMPYGIVDLLRSEDQLEDVGIAVPVSYRLSQDVSIGAMGTAHGKPGKTFFTDHSLSVSFPILNDFDLKGFGEVVTSFWYEEYEWHYSANAGIIYQPVKDIIIDAGAFVGLTELMPGLNVFTGVTFRL